MGGAGEKINIMIKSIKGENFKIIEFIDIHPKKGVTLVCGPNESGKSTIMDLIESTLVGGKKILNPIRDNQKKATTEIEIDDYKIKKIFTEKGVRLEIYDKDGNRQTGGLSLLDDIINKIGFDPGQFTRQNPKEQRETLMKLLKIDFTDLDKQRDILFDERREIGAQKKALPVYEKTDIEYYEKYFDKKELNIVELSNNLEETKEEHKNYFDCQNELEENLTDIKSKENEIKELIKRNEELSKVEKPTVDVSSLQDKITHADKTNRWIRKAKEIKDNLSITKNYSENYGKNTKSIETIDNHKQNVLKTAKMPIEGLSITDECILFNDRPFDQLSTSQQIKISIVISLMLMDDNKEKIIIMREGTLLDDKSIAMIFEIAKEYGCYIFVEMVIKNKMEMPKRGILIQEGKIIAVDGMLVK